MEAYYHPATNYNYSYHHNQDPRYYENDLHWQADYSYQNYYTNYDSWYHHQPEQESVQNRPVMDVAPVCALETALAVSNVLQTILRQCSIHDLKQCRQVCKGWDVESTTILKERIFINFNRVWQLKSYIKGMSCRPDFCSTFCFGPEIALDNSIVQDWITVFGPYLSVLELQNCNLHVDDALCQTLHQLPNLERLTLPSKILMSDAKPSTELVTGCQLAKLKHLIFIGDKTNATLPDPDKVQILFKEMLRISPNLECIQTTGPTVCSSFTQLLKNSEINDLNVLTNASIEGSSDNSTSLDFLLWSTITSTESEIGLKLTKLDLNVKLGINCVQSLVAKNFPLKCLDLKILPEVSNKALHQLLTSLKETLVHLKIRYCGSGRLAYESDLPLTQPLSQLKTLYLERYQGSLCFIEKLPNLTQLSFSKTNLNKVVLKDVECPLKPEGVHGTLTSFKAYQDFSKNEGSDRQRSIQTVQKLGMQFPNVKYLRLEKLVDESLCLIYAQWPNLESLEIVHGHFSDAGTTAIHPNAYKVILREEAYDNYNVDALRQGLFLGNLSKLRRLKIHSPNITDVSLILGVLPCPNIQRVKVQSYKITDTSLYRLACKPSIMSIATKNCNQLSPTAISYTTSTVTSRGGSCCLNPSKGSFNVLQTVQFLQRSPKLRVLLKRLTNKVITMKQVPEKRQRGRPRKRIAFPAPESVAPQETPQESQDLTTFPSPKTIPELKIRTKRPYKKREKLQNDKELIPEPLIAPTTKCIDKEDDIVIKRVQKVKKLKRIVKNHIKAPIVQEEISANPSPPSSALPINAKLSRPVRNTESIFRRYKDFALF